MSPDSVRAFHRSALRAFSAQVMTTRAGARALRAPVVVVDVDRAVTGSVWALDAPEAIRAARDRAAGAVADAVAEPRRERATRVLVFSREGASLWVADGEPLLLAESFPGDGESSEDRKTEPLLRSR
jgi:hypothetical protein